MTRRRLLALLGFAPIAKAAEAASLPPAEPTEIEYFDPGWPEIPPAVVEIWEDDTVIDLEELFGAPIHDPWTLKNPR